MYRLVEEAGVTFVSVGHRSSLRPFHSQLLTLQPPASAGVGGWQGEEEGQGSARLGGSDGEGAARQGALTWRLERISERSQEREFA